MKITVDLTERELSKLEQLSYGRNKCACDLCGLAEKLRRAWVLAKAQRSPPHKS